MINTTIVVPRCLFTGVFGLMATEEQDLTFQQGVGVLIVIIIVVVVVVVVVLIMTTIVVVIIITIIFFFFLDHHHLAQVCHLLREHMGDADTPGVLFAAGGLHRFFDLDAKGGYISLPQFVRYCQQPRTMHMQ
jgi:hypothetical protein